MDEIYGEILQLNQENSRIDMQIQQYKMMVLDSYEKNSFEYKQLQNLFKKFIDFLYAYEKEEYPKEVEAASGLSRYSILVSVSSTIFQLVMRSKTNSDRIKSLSGTINKDNQKVYRRDTNVSDR